MKRVSSTVRPEETQLLQGVMLVNYDVQEEETQEEDGTKHTMYNYGQSRLQKDATASDIAKCVEEGSSYWSKHRKDRTLGSLVVTASRVPFDADNASINYMSSVVSVANFKALKALSEGANAADVYEDTFKTYILWKNADNTISNVQVETVAEALENSMASVGTVIIGTTYNE